MPGSLRMKRPPLAMIRPSAQPALVGHHRAPGITQSSCRGLVIGHAHAGKEVAERNHEILWLTQAGRDPDGPG